MTLHVCLLLLVFFLIFSLVRLCHLSLSHHGPPHSRGGAMRTTIQRLLKPRTPVLATKNIRSKTWEKQPYVELSRHLPFRI
jgi:hypothetical protein